MVDGRRSARRRDQLVDLRTGAERVEGQPASSPIWVQFSPDGKTIVSTSRDGTVTV
jgi:hypothetical protein